MKAHKGIFMRIRIISDIHMEIDGCFYAFNEAEPKADILIIAGDFTVANYWTRGPASPYNRTTDLCEYFFERASKDYLYVLYVPGNHEHYSGYFDKTDEEDFEENEDEEDFEDFKDVSLFSSISLILDGDLSFNEEFDLIPRLKLFSTFCWLDFLGPTDRYLDFGGFLLTWIDLCCTVFLTI